MYHYDVTRTESEKQAVFSLLQNVYKKQGYFSDNSYDETFGKFLSKKSNSKTFTAFINNKLFGTISVVIDSEIGLPMDVLNKKELEQFRNKNKKIAEVTQYAIDHDVLKKENPSLNPLQQLTSSLPLMNLVLHYALFASVDYLCIATVPEHSKFYKNLGFVEFTEKKYYPSVNTWGVGQFLDVAKLKQNIDLPGIMTDLINKKPDYSLFI